MPDIIYYRRLCALSACLSVFMYLLYHEMIIIRMPFKPLVKNAAVIENPILYNNVELFVARAGRLQPYNAHILISSIPEDTIKNLINTLLHIYFEEHLIAKQIAVQSVVIVPHTKTAYISFTHNPINQQLPLYAAWALAQSFLKTIVHNNIAINTLYLLVNHKPLAHSVIDFSHPLLSEHLPSQYK